MVSHESSNTVLGGKIWLKVGFFRDAMGMYYDS